MKRLRIGRRRQQVTASSPLELARAPALVEDKWRVPDRFNFTRDLVEVLAANPKRQALMFVGPDSVIEPRTFHELAEGSNKWAFILTERGIGPGDRVLVLSGATVDWVEIMLGCLKAGAVAVPCSPHLSAAALETRVSVSGASLIVAGDEAKSEIAQMSFGPEVHHVFEGRRRRATDVAEEQPTADTSARDVALLVWTSGTTATPKPVAHTHGWTFAVRTQAEHWLDAGPRDVVWCAAPAGSAQALAGTLFGPWALGAEVVLQDGPFDAMERLELIHRFQTTVLCQSPAEYAALAARRELPRFRSPRLRRLVSTGDYLDPGVIAAFEEAWGLTIHNGYGQAETGVVVSDGRPPAPPEDPGEDESAEERTAGAPKATPLGALGRALPGHHVAIVDEQGNELPPGIEGSLAVRGRPPTLFAGYWDSPDETRDVFRGDWYVTGDVATADEDGFLWFVGRSEDVIASSGRTFGPHAVERALSAHAAVVDSGVVGIRDLQRGGHFVRAYVVLRPGVEASEHLEAELREFAAASILEQQIPREIVFVDGLPRSPSGALRRGELRDWPVAGRPLWETSETDPGEDAATPAPEPISPPRLAAEAAAPVWAAPEPVAEPPELHAIDPAVDAEPRDAVVEAEPTPAPELPREPIAPPSVEEPAAASAYVPAEEWTPPAPVADAVVADEPVLPPDAVVIHDTAAEPVLPEPPAEALDAVALTEALDAPAPEPSIEPDVPLEPDGEAAAVVEPESAEAVGFPPGGDLAQAADVGAEEPVAGVEPTLADWPEPSSASAPEAVEDGPVDTLASEPVTEPALEPVADVAAEQAPPPRLDEPLPDYVVDPERPQAATPPPPEPALPEPEEEEDLGPLPEYVVDPERRLEVVPDPESEPVADATPSIAPTEPAGTTLPAFPPTPVLDLSASETAARGAEDDAERARRRRPRPQAADATKKRGGSAVEPGDDAGEANWMRGLSSRLSHYSLGSETGEGSGDADEEEPVETSEDVEHA